ncbi:DNA/RNA non-specific endonuclease [Synechococcales cyanobacterium C]|uniref:Endonuclease n=1 Tax=Petrachloros mirabilis ULC683 TaxID=2781853 RepID=A0A8K1ZWG9_9CYAN|nr:DNA/RNA non-specific endonuclease [Petrachloros mirabilis]NCJ05336.1 DNA/RNA non-specific endonuclease [Petrachloros mirabilis ULC683]
MPRSKVRWTAAQLKALGALLLLVVLLLAYLLWQQPWAIPSEHLAMGNPSGASVSTPNNYLMQKPQYALSYNNSTRIPNWVSWQLNTDWLGDAPRQNDFRPDESLPRGWYQVVPQDYTGSGYDRGHMIPSGDRTRTAEDNSATFLMTNILPQTPDNNQGPWAVLESECRTLAREGKELYILSGGYGRRRTIAEGRVIPPQHLWKVIVVIDEPSRGIRGVTPQTRVIAVDMPNEQGIRMADWRTFRVSVDALEATTGYDFLSNLPQALQRTLEAAVDNQ